jgi:methionyl aminopeptidase
MKMATEQVARGQAKTGIELRDAFLMWVNGLGAGWTAPFSAVDDYGEPICVSINDEVVHSRPTGEEFKPGDIVTIDAGLAYRTWCADMARTVIVQPTKIDEEECQQLSRLITATQNGLIRGTRQCVVGNKIKDISMAIWLEAQKDKYGVIIDFSGHSIGKKLHEEPLIPNIAKKHKHAETILRPGMVICLEPMFTLGEGKAIVDEDGWRVFTADGSKAAHLENTIAITKDGPRILTKTGDIF